MDADALRTAAAAVAHASGDFAKRIAWVIDDSLAALARRAGPRPRGRNVLGGYDPARWKREGERPQVETLVLCGEADGLAEAAARAATIAEWTNRARDLVNSPPNEATPGAARGARAGDRRRRSST